jgi:hypothetical protein
MYALLGAPVCFGRGPLCSSLSQLGMCCCCSLLLLLLLLMLLLLLLLRSPLLVGEELRCLLVEPEGVSVRRAS